MWSKFLALCCPKTPLLMRAYQDTSPKIGVKDYDHRMQCLDDFCFIFKIPFSSPTTVLEAKPHRKTSNCLDLGPIWWLPLQRLNGKKMPEEYGGACNLLLLQLAVWWGHVMVWLSTRIIYIYNSYLPWNSTIDTKYSHIWSRRYIIQTYPSHHCW